MKILQISSPIFHRVNTWVATVMSLVTNGQLESAYFYVEKKIIIKIVLNGFFHLAATTA